MSPSPIHANGDVCLGPAVLPTDIFQPPLPLGDLGDYCGPRSLKAAAADWLGVVPSRIFVGHGVDHITSLAVMVFATGKSAVSFWPAYPFVETFMRTAGCVVARVHLNEDGSYPAFLPSEIVNSRPCLVVAVNPTNPGGKSLAAETLRNWIGQVPDALFVIDEAYVDFSPELSLLDEAHQQPQVLIVRGVSKGYGLPGLRLGFAYASNEAVIEGLEAARALFFSPLTVELGCRLLFRAPALAMSVSENLRVKDMLQREIMAIPGLDVADTAANFLLVRVQDHLDPTLIQRKSTEAGAIFWWFNETQQFIRYFGAGGGHPSLRRSFRISPVKRSEIRPLIMRLAACVTD